MSITITTNMGLKKPDQNTREPASIFTSFNPNTDLIDSHDHSSGKGVGIKRIQTGTTPAAAGELQVTGDAFRWWGATAGAVRTAQDLESAQTVTGVKTHQAQIVSALGTIAADTPGFAGTVTWNNAAVAFTGLRLNVTDASSAAGSLLADLQVGGSSKLAVRKDGQLSLAGVTLTPGGASALGLGTTPSGAWWSSVQAFQFGQGALMGYGAATNQLRIGVNTVQTSTGFVSQQTNAATLLEQTGTYLALYHAPSVAAGAAQTFTSRWQVNSTGEEDQVHDFTNGVTYQTQEISNGSAFYGREKIQRTVVSTSATAIMAVQNSWTATLVLVSANDGGPNGFTDLLLVCANVSSVTVLSQISSGSPPTRTYAHSAGLNPITLALSGGTYTVTARSFEATGG